MVFAVVVDFLCCYRGLYWRVLFGLDSLVGGAFVCIFRRGLDKCVGQVGKLLYGSGVEQRLLAAYLTYINLYSHNFQKLPDSTVP